MDSRPRVAASPLMLEGVRYGAEVKRKSKREHEGRPAPMEAQKIAILFIVRHSHKLSRLFNATLWAFTGAFCKRG